MAVKHLKVYPVLLAGGSGTRLWPVSRELYPKQLVKFIGTDSLVQNTIKRLSPVLDSENVRIVCGREHYHEMARHMELIGIPAGNKIICEPCGRNTAPAILLAIFEILKQEEEAVVCVFPADHVIGDIPKFHEKLEAAVKLAEQGHIVTFGIQPNYPETGYGYIEGKDRLEHGALRLKRFVEKPDLETARQYIAAGTYFWNAGMFAFRVSVMVAEFKAHQPKMVAQMATMMGGDKTLSRESYGQLENISIDYAIMERTDKGAVLPSDFGWSDIGSWKSLYDFLPKNQDDNVLDGDVITNKTRNCFIMGHERLIATNCVENLVVVDTPDSVFISNIENSRDVKSIVSELKNEGREEYHHHRTVYYPWGNITKLENRPGFQVDRLQIYPGSIYREASDELKAVHLSVIEGRIRIERDGEQRETGTGSGVHFNHPVNAVLENRENKAATIIRIRIAFKTASNGAVNFKQP